MFIHSFSGNKSEFVISKRIDGHLHHKNKILYIFLFQKDQKLALRQISGQSCYKMTKYYVKAISKNL